MPRPAAVLAKPHPSTIAPRAVAIARGLRRTGRVGDLRSAPPSATDGDAERWIVLPASGADRFYFIGVDGTVLRGADFADADELSHGFSDAMERAGTDINSDTAESAPPSS